MPLPRGFYARPARAVAKDLLGCVLVSRRGRTITAGRIVEVEAYLGPDDKASHAAFRPGSRSIFYGKGGIVYVYLNYGVHRLLNAITGPVGRPGCVLIRALEPLLGLATMARRRGVTCDSPTLASGPGNVARALGITLAENGADLTAGRLTIEPPDRPRDFRIASGPRVGITRSVELRLRFWIAGNRFVSASPAEASRRSLAGGGRGRAGSPPRPVASGRRPATSPVRGRGRGAGGDP